jgi:hypothetical protein
MPPIDTVTDKRAVLADYLREDYLREDAFAQQLGRALRTIREWRKLGKGPPVTWVGQTPLYRIEAVKDWLRASEKRQPREHSGRRNRTGRKPSPNTPLTVA